MSRSIVVCAVHPDDETLGCGGTLLRHKAAGDSIHWLIFTKIAESQGFAPEQVASRAQTIADVSADYSFDSVHELGFHTTQLDTVPMATLAGAVSSVFREVEPNVVYLPFKHDAHTDHQVAFNAAYSCTKVFRYPSVEQVLMMETISETDFAPGLAAEAFAPNVFVDVSAHFERKLAILERYATELAPPPFPRNARNVQSLASYRGSQAGCAHAEAFCLLKGIVR